MNSDIQNKKIQIIKEYKINSNNKIYKLSINKTKTGKKIIIICDNYKIKLNLEEIIKRTKIYLETIEEAFNLIINLFDSNKVTIKESLNQNIIILYLKIFNNINNKEEEVFFNLEMENKEKEKIINDIYYKYTLLQDDIISIKNENQKNKKLISYLLDEIKIIKKENMNIKTELNKLKLNYNNNIINNKSKINEKNNEDRNNIEIDDNNSNSPKINSSITLINDAYGYYDMDNTFITLNSSNGISHIIYVKENNSIIDYNLTERNIISEIKNAHEKIITSFSFFTEKINKKDLIMSISAEDCNIKLWNLNNWECIIYLKNIYLTGCLFSGCFINENKNIYIVTSNCADSSDLIKIYNLQGEIVKEISDSYEETYFIDVYYEYEVNKIFIITGNKGYVKSYDYVNNKLYKKYYDSDLNKSHDSIVVSKYKENEEIVNLIDSCQNGFISIWNFHLGNLLHKINIGYNYLEGICLWNEKYLFVGGGDSSIKLIEIKNGLIIKSLSGHNENVLSVKKIENKKYGHCLISQGNDGQIKLWIQKIQEGIKNA